MTSTEEMLLMPRFMRSVFKLTLQYLKVLDLMWHNNHIQITPSMFCSSYGWCPDVKSYLYSLSQFLTSAINQDVGHRTQLLLYESIELSKRQLGLMVQLALSFVNALSSGEFIQKLACMKLLYIYYTWESERLIFLSDHSLITLYYLSMVFHC